MKEVINNLAKNKIDSKRYTYSFFISIAIFLSAFLLSNYFSNTRVAEVRTLQENISLDILSNSAQFDLLSQVSCGNLDQNVLSSELSDIGNKLTFTESQRGSNDNDVKYLSKYYSLLQIKDYTLSKKLAEKCANRKTTFIVYFYSNSVPCEDCKKESSVLTSLREKYPDLRVYSFPVDSDLSAVKTLKNIYKIKDSDTLPILIIEDKVYTSLKTFDELDNLLPEKLKLTATTTSATSSKSKNEN